MAPTAPIIAQATQGVRDRPPLLGAWSASALSPPFVAEVSEYLIRLEVESKKQTAGSFDLQRANPRARAQLHSKPNG
jgi:hypothetical protein